MATLISAATGNLTAAGTWKKVAAAGILQSTGATTALTTSNLDSATFVLGATAVDAVALKLASRASGSPSNTITVTLRNSTAGTNPLTLTINVSDLPACDTTAAEGGWIVFKFGSSHTPNGTDSYLIRVVLSSTSTAVSLYTNGTANNWARMVRETTTQAPTTGDDMIVAGEHTGAGTGNDVTVTQNQTAATDYGSASTSVEQAALNVCKRGALVSGTTAATNYLLRLSGHCQVYSGGTFSLGDGSTQIPRDSSSILEFDCAADGDFGLYIRSGATCNLRGLSRTSGKDIVTTKLTADAASSATSLTVADDTGWLNGDEIALASTTRTNTQRETATLNANAGASSLSLSAGLTNAHGGSASSKVQAEVILLTRNVQIRSVSSSAMAFVYCGPTSTINFQWAGFRYLGTNSGVKLGVSFDNTSAFTCRYCVARNGEYRGFYVQNSASDGWTIRDCTVYLTTESGFKVAATSGTTWTLQDVVAMGCSGSIDYAIDLADIGGTLSGLTTTSGGQGLRLTDSGATNWTLDGITSHSNGNMGSVISSQVGRGTVKIGAIYRNSDVGLELGSQVNTLTVEAATSGGYLFGNTTSNIQTAGSTWQADMILRNLTLAGDSTFSTGRGLFIQNTTINFRLEGCSFGNASGIYVAHSSQDVNISTGGLYSVEATFVNCLLASSTEVSNLTFSSLLTKSSRFAFQSHDQTAGDDKISTAIGTISKETTTFDVTPSLKMAPSSAILKLESNAGVRGRGLLVRVASGATKTINVKVQKDGSYNGAAPRLVLKSNPAVGITADTVLDTLSVGSGTWETLTGTTAAATADGVFEAVVDCDGTAGAVYVDTPSVS
jgi:hypothetical protein